MEFLLLLVALALLIFNIWLFVVGVQFLRTGTQAFKRYLAVTGAPYPEPRRQEPPAPGLRPWERPGERGQ